MFWSEENIISWVEHINSVVGNDSPEGGFLIAEKTDSVEVSMAGEKEELLQLLAASIYDYSKMHELAFEDALKEISDEWDKMREKKGYMQCGGEVIDLETGIGFNSETNMISFPTPPKDVQDKMIAAIEQMNGKTDEVKERLHSVKDIFEFFDECTEVGEFIADEETGEKGLAFVYKSDRYLYIPHDDSPSMLSYSSESGGMGIDFFEEDEIFKKVVRKILEESSMS